jgi:hypothetical protein
MTLDYGDDHRLAVLHERNERTRHYENLKFLSRHYSIPCSQVTKERRRGVGWDHDNAGLLPHNPNRDRMTDGELAEWAVQQISSQGAADE